VRELLEPIESAFAAALDEARGDRDALSRVRVRFLGRKGELTAALKQLGAIATADRPRAGKALNELKTRIQGSLESAIEDAASPTRTDDDAGRLEATLPGRVPWRGSIHPVTQVTRELEQIFREMGYAVELGPEVEDDFHNFQALNIPSDHPARDDSDTFYVDGELLLRTHTSPVQIRTMEKQEPPVRMICAGRAYRRDQIDATHLPMFHQLEALVVDRGISMADLKGTLETVWHRFFGADVRTRLRPGYFPFVEPGCEYDISCRVCGGSGCKTCRGGGWIELGGAGMVHPAVFEAVGIDPEVYTGFAFGLGIDRIAMMRYEIDDLRLLLENDTRFLAQFPV
jgi:phenylalanyl-tRNA synthetase alpha chain